jgi:predicted RNA-binding Zn-ribbon protein involved in translation (DUF1610 family)
MSSLSAQCQEYSCWSCGYNLSGLAAEGRCPECGESIRASRAQWQHAALRLSAGVPMALRVIEIWIVCILLSELTGVGNRLVDTALLAVPLVTLVLTRRALPQQLLVMDARIASGIALILLGAALLDVPSWLAYIGRHERWTVWLPVAVWSFAQSRLLSCAVPATGPLRKSLVAMAILWPIVLLWIGSLAARYAPDYSKASDREVIVLFAAIFMVSWTFWMSRRLRVTVTAMHGNSGMVEALPPTPPGAEDGSSE